MQAVKVVTQHRVNPSKLLLLKLHFDHKQNKLSPKQRETYHALMRTHYPIHHGPRVSRKHPPKLEIQINTEMSTLWQ